MEDLREKTHTQHYELYRQKRLQEMGFTDLSADNRPIRYVERDPIMLSCTYRL